MMATLHLNVEFSAVSDENGKFGRLAKLLGLADADHARGKCEHLWVACTRRGEVDLPQWLVEQILGESGPPALVEAELARWSSGRGDSKTRRLHISGAAKHCTWLLNKQEQTSKAGKVRASRASRVSGKFAKSPPAKTSPSELSSELRSPEEENPSPARTPAIPPSMDGGPAPRAPTSSNSFDAAAARLRERGALAEAIWQRLSELREKHATKLGLAGVLPFPVVHPGNQPRGFRELLDRIREEGDGAHNACDHVLLVLDAQATVSRDIEWLSEKAFLSGPWSKARETPLKAKRKPPQPSPRVELEDRGGLVSLDEIAAAQATLGVRKETA